MNIAVFVRLTDGGDQNFSIFRYKMYIAIFVRLTDGGIGISEFLGIRCI